MYCVTWICFYFYWGLKMAYPLKYSIALLKINFFNRYKTCDFVFTFKLFSNGDA